MDKTGKENIPCTYCGNDAVDGTYPPVCEEHLAMQKTASEDKSMKELDADADV